MGQAATARERAVRLRNQAKVKRPSFVRQESWRYKRLKESWRRPRGLDNKMRRKIKGWPATVAAGYRGPRYARGLHPSGFRERLIHNPEELRHVDPKSEAIRIAHAVGKRKKARILSEARKRSIKILNFREIRETPPMDEAAMAAEEAAEETHEKGEKKADVPKTKRKRVKKSEKKVKDQ